MSSHGILSEECVGLSLVIFFSVIYMSASYFVWICILIIYSSIAPFFLLYFHINTFHSYYVKSQSVSSNKFMNFKEDYKHYIIDNIQTTNK
jgi:hypothetical protein